MVCFELIASCLVTISSFQNKVFWLNGEELGSELIIPWLEIPRSVFVINPAYPFEKQVVYLDDLFIKRSVRKWGIIFDAVNILKYSQIFVFMTYFWKSYDSCMSFIYAFICCPTMVHFNCFKNIGNLLTMFLSASYILFL